MRSPEGKYLKNEHFQNMRSPSLLISDAEGKEIDRLSGFKYNLDGYKAQLEKYLNGIDLYENIKNQYRKNPDDLTIAFKMAQKLHDRKKYKEASEIYYFIAANPFIARTIEVDLPYSRDRVNLYENVRYKLSSDFSYRYSPVRISMLERFINEFPNGFYSLSAYKKLAYHYAIKGNKDKAKKFYINAINKYPEEIVLVTNFLLYSQNQINGIDYAVKFAEKTYNYCKSLIKNDINLNEARRIEISTFLKEYAKFCLKTNYKIKHGIEIAVTALELTPEEASCHEILAKLYSADKRLEKALEIYGPEYIEYETDYSVLDNYFQFWIKEGINIESAINAAEKMINFAPFDYRIREKAAKVCLNSNRIDKAMQMYGEKFRKMFKDNYFVLNRYADFWISEGKNINNALSAAEHSVTLKPDSDKCWNTLALIHYNLKNYKEALKAQKKALELNPDAPYYMERLKKIKNEIEKK